MQRIEEFLAEQDVPDWASSLKTSIHRHVPSEIRVSAASFEFHRASKVYPRPACFQLGPLDITFPKGQLSLVSGATGSGKSALLAALLGGKFLARHTSEISHGKLQKCEWYLEVCIWTSKTTTSHIAHKLLVSYSRS